MISSFFDEDQMQSTVQINSPSIHLDFYYCQTCHGIPKLQIIYENGYQIEISCYTCRCHPKRITLEQFTEEIKMKRKIKGCIMDYEHGASIAKTYCVDCSNWFCDKCLLNHNKLNSKHSLLLSDGLEMRNRCDIKDCDNKLKFYCTDCNSHLCYECKDKLHKDHLNKIKEIESFYKDGKKWKICHKSKMNKTKE